MHNASPPPKPRAASDPQRDRTLYANDALANVGFVDNTIITSRYTLWNFLPLFLVEAFTRMANAYFLMVCILQSIPEISITNGVPTSFLPLGIVLIFDGFATAREDYKRHVDDHRANNTQTLVMREGRFQHIPWSNIHVGDILKIKRNEQVPADAVFLSSFAADSDTPDTCYVQTAQLDGETNLKLRAAVPASVAFFKSDSECANFRGSLMCEAPNASFDKFVGLLRLTPGVAPALIGSSINDDGRGTALSRGTPLEAEQLLLRGVYLRNVDYAYAMVVYTGRETKVRVRQTSRPVKRAGIEQALNRLILCLIALLLFLCLLGTVGNVIWTNMTYSGHWYFGKDSKPITLRLGVLQFFTFFLLNASFIPISLYVTVRLARSLQMIFMEADLQMLHVDLELVKSSHGEEGHFPFKVRSMELNDELGQITHIFSDKTGTLTLNYMEWRKILINGISHGLGTTQIGIDRLRREGKDVTSLTEALASEKLRGTERGAQLPHVNFEDGSESNPGRTLGSDSRNPSDGAQGQAIHDMLLNLALNHTVLPEIVRDSFDIVTGTRLSASSPDEEAFCYAAETLGYKFVSRTHEGVLLKIRHAPNLMPFRRATVPISAAAKNASALLSGGVRASESDAYPGTEYPFRVLHVLAYSQERKRMSIIVEHPIIDTDGTVHVTGATRTNAVEGGDIYLYCKGADSVIIPRCTEPRTPAEADVVSRTTATLASWGCDGLRTLVFAVRKISREEYVAWARQYEAASTDIEELRKKKDKRPNAIEDLQAAIEKGFTLQGAMANEDKLQPEVPETIALLARAGIKLWMVTGDKQETAVNIGFATKLLTESQRQIVSTMESAGGVNAAMRRLRIAAKRMRSEKAEAKRLMLLSDSQSHGSSVSSWAAAQIDLIERSFGIRSPQRGGGGGGGGDSTSLRGINFDTSGGPVFDNASIRIGMESINTPRLAGADAEAMFESDDEEEAIATGDGLIAEQAIGHVGSPTSMDTLPISDSLSPISIPRPMMLRTGTLNNPMIFPSDSAISVTPSAITTSMTPSSSIVGNPVHPSNMLAASERRMAGSVNGGIAPLGRPSNRPFALVIDEHCLDAALQNPRAKAYLLYVAINCDAVIACRARPDQKAQVVRLIRNGIKSSVTMAVGDGANDVDMIGTAHVGVGIAGAEGVQAANASDFSIGRFRYLQRLLLVHGRWNYLRMTRLVLYMFWKNVMFVVCQFFYQTINGFSGQKWYVEFAAQVFNIVFTGLPPLLLAVTDRDMSAEWALRFPKLYDHGRLALGLRTSTFLLWMLDAVSLSAIFFILTIYGYSSPDGYQSPHPGGTSYVFTLGTVAFSMVIVAASIRIAVESFQHNFIMQGIIGLSAIMWIPLCFIFDAMKQDGMKGANQYIFSSANFWLVVMLGSMIMGLRITAWKAGKRFYAPELRHIVAEVAAIEGDAFSVEQYANAADLARRTGKPLREILAADRIAAAAAEVLAPISAFSVPVAASFLAMTPVRSVDRGGSDYGVLSGGDTPEAVTRRLLLEKSGGSVTSPSTSYLTVQHTLPDVAHQARSDLVNVTRRAILEGSVLPRMSITALQRGMLVGGGGGGSSEFDNERSSDVATTPVALSPMVVLGKNGGSEIGEAVAIEDMKARLQAGLQRINVSAAVPVGGGIVSAIARKWPPGTLNEDGEPRY